MKYRVDLSIQTMGRLREMDQHTAGIIMKWLRTYIEGCEDPRKHGGALLGDADKWRYRVGSYKLLARIDDESGKVLVVWIGTMEDT